MAEFGESLYRYGYQAGMLFAKRQGGPYAGKRAAELVERFKETIAALKGVESARAQLQQDNAALSAAFDKCADNNLQLYEISNAVLDRYEHVGLFTKVGSAEPFTKITRTRIDNLVDEYRARAEELRSKKRVPQEAVRPSG